jgi:hypothetical protein
LHDLAGLAVPALRDVTLDPRALERVIAPKTLDRRDLNSLRAFNR